jgi:trimeric autotransporter adhesin
MKKHPKENATKPINAVMKKRIGWPRKHSGFSFILITVALACSALAPVAHARQPSEDRGNGNSAAEGVDALNPSTTGSDNTAHGWFSLFSNTTGSSNTADGVRALFANTAGERNSAFGWNALTSNTSGNENTANGYQALFSNTVGESNTANGFQALYNNLWGSDNTATGDQALWTNYAGQGNVATGWQALYSNTTGNQNTADGAFALYSNTTGAFNTAYGTLALFHNTTGRHNTALGEEAGSDLTTGDGNVCIGYDVRGVAGEYDTTRIRNIYPRLATERAVYVTSDNKLGTLFSTRRVKDDIKPMDKASEAILALKPVTFRYKKEVEPNGAIQFGLIAEEVADVDPDLVILDKGGKPESVRYEAINSMLLNEFLKEHKKVAKLEATLEAVNARLQEQAAQIQKVTAQIDATKPLPHLVLNNP